MITREDLSELMSFRPEPYLTTSVYLEIDGSPQESHTIVLKDLLKQRKQDLEKQDLPGEVRKSVEGDFKRISDFVNLEFNRHGVRTLILFSCSARKWWKVLTFPLAIRNRVIVNAKPSTRPLIFLLDQYTRFLVILIGRMKAKIFEYYAGEIAELAEIFEEVPAKVKEGGYAGYEERRIERHIEDHVRRHLKNVADTGFDLFKKNQDEACILLGTEQNARDLSGVLRSPLSEKVVAIEQEEMDVSISTIRERVMKIEGEKKAERDEQGLEKLFGEARSGGLGVLGLESTVRAIQQGQVNILFVQRGYEKPGFRCRECKTLLPNNGPCDYCDGKTDPVHDIVEEVIQDAALQNCQIKYITLPGSRLEKSGGKIGAILRFKT